MVPRWGGGGEYEGHVPARIRHVALGEAHRAGGSGGVVVGVAAAIGDDLGDDWTAGGILETVSPSQFKHEPAG